MQNYERCIIRLSTDDIRILSKKNSIGLTIPNLKISVKGP